MRITKEIFKEKSDDFVKDLIKQDITLDYTLDSLKQVDSFLQGLVAMGLTDKENPLNKSLDRIVLSIAAYLGETLIKIIPNSEWVIPIEIIETQVVINNALYAFPIKRVINCLRTGTDDSLFSYGIHLVSASNNEV
ncbi:MAG: hypothetical protein JJE44_02165 [Flavobacteriaceae bacterium]|nr:hypothetical protein [Flavobacteriaceae bacterium]